MLSLNEQRRPLPGPPLQQLVMELSAADGAGTNETEQGPLPAPGCFPASMHKVRQQGCAMPQPRPSLLRAVVQSVTIACCAAARVTVPLQTAVCSFVSTRSFLL